MATKKAAKTVQKPKVVSPLANDGKNVMKQLGLEFDTYEGGFYQDAPPAFTFFNVEEKYTLRHSCAVVEIGAFRDAAPDRLTPEQALELFKFSVEYVLKAKNRKQAVATTTAKQTYAASMLEAAGFKPCGTSVNPGTRSAVTVWVLSI